MAHLKVRLRSVPRVYVFGAFGLIATAYWAIQSINDPARLSAVLLMAAIIWGLLSTGWTLMETLSELSAQRARKPGDRVLARIAWANVRREVLRIVELLAFMVIATSVLSERVNSLVNRSLLILIVLLLVTNGVLDRIERDQTAIDLAEVTPPEAG